MRETRESHQLRENRVQIPLEGFALQVVSQLDTVADVAEVTLVRSYALIVVLGVVVHPHFCETNRVSSQYVDSRAPLEEDKMSANAFFVSFSMFTLYGERLRKM
jgi:hypothetical protein